jgi:hypothetical protein
LMETPYLRPIFQEFAFKKVKFRFGYACCSLDKNLSLDALEPSSWYAMPGD